MAYGQGTNVQFCYVTEVTYGTTPSTPAMVKLPVTKVTGGLSRSALADTTLDGLRTHKLPRLGMNKVPLTIEGLLRYGDFDAWIAAACRSTWASNTVSVGSTAVSFTGETGYTDIVQYFPYPGLTPSKMSMSIKPDSEITVTFDCICKTEGAASATPLKASPTAYSTNSPFDSFTGSITEGGSAIAIVTGIDFTLDNRSSGLDVLFSKNIIGVIDQSVMINGTLGLHFTSVSQYNKFVNETASSIVVTLTSPENDSLAINFASVKYTGATKDVSGDGPVPLSMPFEATNVQFTRTAHV